MIKITCKFKRNKCEKGAYFFSLNGKETMVNDRTVVFEITDSNDVLLTLHSMIDFNDFKSVKLEVI